jgi:hypothetical protein
MIAAVLNLRSGEMHSVWSAGHERKKLAKHTKMEGGHCRHARILEFPSMITVVDLNKFGLVTKKVALRRCL